MRTSENRKVGGSTPPLATKSRRTANSTGPGLLLGPPCVSAGQRPSEGQPNEFWAIGFDGRGGWGGRTFSVRWGWVGHRLVTAVLREHLGVQLDRVRPPARGHAQSRTTYSQIHDRTTTNEVQPVPLLLTRLPDALNIPPPRDSHLG